MGVLITETTHKSRRRKIHSSASKAAEKVSIGLDHYVDAYGNFIWALAKKFTTSNEEAEAAAREIFIDIWKFAERTDKFPTIENFLISHIARRRLLKYLLKAE